MSTVTVVAIITAKPGKREDLLALARANLAAVRAEAGCIEYGLVVDVDGFGPNQAPMGPDTFAFVEKQPPYDVRIMQLKDSDIDLGERQATRGLAILAECIDRGEWPGFDGHEQHISFVEMPAWSRTRIETELSAEAA